MKRLLAVASALGLVLSVFALSAAQALAAGSFLGRFSTVSTVASTVPANGDVNPYGVAVVRRSTGNLIAGDVLVSNFNNSANLQGTGHTIVEISPGGHRTVFADIDAEKLGTNPCPGGVGLTTALSVLSSGWVIVGSLPTTNGLAATAKAGCLIVLDNMGNVAETIAGSPINGPWDMTALDLGSTARLFVTNVLNGTVAANGKVVHKGTVVRITLAIASGHAPAVVGETIIGSGFPERTDPAALVIGPTGVDLDAQGNLYVADSLANRIARIAHAVARSGSAGAGQTVSRGGKLNDPLGLAIAPNGDVLTVNGNDGFIVETTPAGKQIASTLLDKSGSPPGAGALFGLAVAPRGAGIYFVDDATNTLDHFH
jgi:hypothetical protein